MRLVSAVISGLALAISLVAAAVDDWNVAENKICTEAAIEVPTPGYVASSQRSSAIDQDQHKSDAITHNSVINGPTTGAVENEAATKDDPPAPGEEYCG
ncbi:hypothetical protein K458DRAFT_383174 [Lentithecium fluviatile CBS 122367]|uniref:Uncharacterized protein n=1 Tax=Lentithecium fluviatile CBS 122367 TaxID=1168545 RepID=A0A6G1JIH3_9PLEO|nr:hypothetical protein K458DRAFT_383174 [Lentithecium fluviatile CBS 122367]